MNVGDLVCMQDDAEIEIDIALWGPDGNELFRANPEETMLVVDNESRFSMKFSHSSMTNYSTVLCRGRVCIAYSDLLEVL